MRARRPVHFEPLGVGHPEFGLVKSEETPIIVAGVCDPGIPTATGLREAG